MIIIQGQTAIIQATLGRAITGYTSAIINLKKPTGIIVPITATVTDVPTGAITATVAATVFDTIGLWTAWAVVLITGGTVIKTFPDAIEVRQEGVL
jgi:hypothetical protein